jgi:Low-density lipoprotein receptor domain class A
MELDPTNQNPSNGSSVMIVIFFLHSTKYYNCVAGCPSGQFRCASGECVLETLRCDGTNDCGDKSDEALCTQKNDKTQTN